MTDMRLAEHYLSIEITQKSGKITLSQSAFIIEILECFGMQDLKLILMSMKHEA